MRRLLVLVLLLPLLGACVDGIAQRQAFFGQFVGKSEVDLVRGLGVPTRTFDTDGRHFLAYTEQTLQAIPGGLGYGYGWGGGWGRGPGFYGVGSTAGVIVRTCEATFEVVDAKVMGFTLMGNACAY